tara:strand:- start:300 stop:848 length:549 start_codon:yes stop_codon:yes gene_type:complete
MVNRPSVPEIITVNSETLQTQIRDLLPSQNGFGSELQASNVITPIIDLTSAAEGSSIGSNLQTAIAFGSQTTFNVTNSSAVLANSPGFYRVFGVASIRNANVLDQTASFTLTDGSTTKTVWQMYSDQGGTGVIVLEFDFIVWLTTGDSISAVSSGTEMRMVGSSRQVADSAGVLVNPSGFPL